VFDRSVLQVKEITLLAVCRRRCRRRRSTSELHHPGLVNVGGRRPGCEIPVLEMSEADVRTGTIRVL